MLGGFPCLPRQPSLRSDHQLESRMREIRLSGLEGGGAYSALPTPIMRRAELSESTETVYMSDTPSSEKTLLDPQFLARLEQLELVSRKIFLGRMQGERRSKKKGQSVEFADYRNYVIGDDLRFLDPRGFAGAQRDHPEPLVGGDGEGPGGAAEGGLRARRAISGPQSGLHR